MWVALATNARLTSNVKLFWEMRLNSKTTEETFTGFTVFTTKIITTIMKDMLHSVIQGHTLRLVMISEIFGFCS